MSTTLPTPHNVIAACIYALVLQPGSLRCASVAGNMFRLAAKPVNHDSSRVL